MDYMKALGITIRDIRKERKLSVSELHYRVRLSHQAITKIERGAVSPRLDRLLAICEALEMNPSTLFALAERRL